MAATNIRTRLFLLVLVAAGLVMSACAAEDEPTLQTDNTPTEPGLQTDDRGDDETSQPETVVESGLGDTGDGLLVRMTGEVNGQEICPGSTRPCVTVDRDLGAGVQSVLVRLVEGTATVVESEPVEDEFRARYTDRCDDILPESDFLAVASLSDEEQEAAEADGTYAYDVLGQYILTIPDSYAVRWLSNTQRVHLGVVGDTAPHVEALEELGLGDVVCVAGGFLAADAELERVQADVGPMLEDWAPLNEGAGWGRDAFAGTVTVGLYEVDESMLNDAAQRFGELVELTGAFVVLNGSVDDLRAQIERNAGIGGSGGNPTGLVATCGTVVFSTIPPDVEEFPPLDDETRAIFDEFIDGPLGAEAAFIADADMRIAERTDTTLELFGLRDGGYVNASFERFDGVWSPRGWGGCNLSVSAPGLGPAQTMLDPDVEPDADSTTLHIWIQELSCASGQAPDDRDVIPVVVESADRVEITTLVAPVPGGATCPGNPWFPVVVELDAPLGDRVVVDMHEPPGAELAWPPVLGG